MTGFRRFKFITTLVLEFKKIENDDKTKCETFYSHSKAETFINKSDIDGIFKSICTTILSNIQENFQAVLLIQS